MLHQHRFDIRCIKQRANILLDLAPLNVGRATDLDLVVVQPAGIRPLQNVHHLITLNLRLLTQAIPLGNEDRDPVF